MKSQVWKFVYWPTVWLVALWPWPIDISSNLEPKVFFRLLGVAILLYGLVIHIIAGKTLKMLGHSAKNLTIWPDVLVTTGIYEKMRHPQHLGLTLIPIGIAFLICTWQALLGAGWTTSAALFFIMAVEEPECLRKFSDAYFMYMKNTPAFSMGPWDIYHGINFLRGLGLD